MFKYFAKKWLIGQLNSIMKDYKQNIADVCSQIEIWITRIDKILTQLKSIKTKVQDGELTEDEVNEAKTEIEGLVKSW